MSRQERIWEEARLRVAWPFYSEAAETPRGQLELLFAGRWGFASNRGLALRAGSDERAAEPDSD
jgi:hypothetical protein